MLRLCQFARDNGFAVGYEVSDVASRLNQQRRGLAKVLNPAERGGYKKLLIEYPDRLVRFGYSYIERHLRYCGVEIVVITERSRMIVSLNW
ncbi:MAG: recombinase family protein [Peptococcaceae bacterium]|jgi:predicted site-specific integrase-resolvase|nr:recombinase family protein [Peptococcaceae bacterium]